MDRSTEHELKAIECCAAINLLKDPDYDGNIPRDFPHLTLELMQDIQRVCYEEGSEGYQRCQETIDNIEKRVENE